MDQEKLKGLLHYLASSLARTPDAVEIAAEETERALVLTLRVAEDDMGRIIGKGGKTARAIRDLMKAANDSRDKQVVVDIAE